MKKSYYILSFFICLLLIVNLIINIPLLKSVMYGYDVSNAKYDIGVYIYVIVMIVCLVAIILNIIGIWLYKKDKNINFSIVLIILSIICFLFLFIHAVYTLNSTINLLNQYEGSTAPHLYVHILQLIFSFISICLEGVKLVILNKK